MTRHGMLKYFFPILVTIMLFFSGCSFSWLPPDEQISSLVESYYLYFYSGQQVEAKVIERGEYSADCKCYPVKLEVCMPERTSCNKTFYFFKNGYGKVEVSEYKPRYAAPNRV